MGSTKKLLLIILYYNEHILYINDNYYNLQRIYNFQ